MQTMLWLRSDPSSSSNPNLLSSIKIKFKSSYKTYATKNSIQKSVIKIILYSRTIIWHRNREFGGRQNKAKKVACYKAEKANIQKQTVCKSKLLKPNKNFLLSTGLICINTLRTFCIALLNKISHF